MEEQVETGLGEMPKWVQGAMDVPKGESAAETAGDLGTPPEPARNNERSGLLAGKADRGQPW